MERSIAGSDSNNLSFERKNTKENQYNPDQLMDSKISRK
jgi:hypothetical protein